MNIVLRIAFLVFGLIAQASCYFVVTQPSKDTPWQNGVTNTVTWTKGLLDGIDAFDLKMKRLGSEGLILIVRAVPVSPASLNIRLSDVPPADDYFLLFTNSTPGKIYTISERFKILLDSDAPVDSKSTVDPSAPTVTVSGPPNPTQDWFATFPVMAVKVNSARGLKFGPEKDMWVVAFVVTVVGCVLGTAIAL